MNKLEFYSPWWYLCLLFSSEALHLDIWNFGILTSLFRTGTWHKLSSMLQATWRARRELGLKRTCFNQAASVKRKGTIPFRLFCRQRCPYFSIKYIALASSCNKTFHDVKILIQKENLERWNDKKNVKKKGRVWHLPDSRLQTLLKQREPSEKIKYKELSVNTMSTADKSHSVDR